MNRICVDIKTYEELLPELKFTLGELGDNLIGDALLWI